MATYLKRIHRNQPGCPLEQLDLGTWSLVTKAPLSHLNILLRQQVLQQLVAVSEAAQ